MTHTELTEFYSSQGLIISPSILKPLECSDGGGVHGYTSISK
jgi:hypothetical protein